MRNVGKVSFSLLAWGLLLGLSGSAATAQEPPGKLSETWVVHVKAGQGQQFEEAFQKHLTVRKEKGEPWDWDTWVPVTGADLSSYVVRSCCHAWKDLDSYEAWATEKGLVADWNENVHPYVERYEHYYGEVDLENSHWPLSEGMPAFVGVSSHYPRMGAGQAMAQHMEALSTAAKQMEWPYQWAWIQRVGGEGELLLVVAYDNFAAMEPPEKTFAAALAEKVGAVAATQMFDAWADNFEKTRYDILRYRADMSLSIED